ncbi:GM19845 [Drosophila sechellia]|uniref:GM19845 n=1 Tax=Drosophila sechellia TaxID=7238 RepID=B4HPD0_DROSE|nr:GM19845 [Drosophila sechellia]
MNPNVILPGVFLAALFLMISVSEAPYIKLTNVVCESKNKSWAVFHYCRLKAYSRNKTSMNINATFLHPTNNVSLRLKMVKRLSGYKPFLFDITIDACRFLRKRHNPVIKMFYSFIKDYSTLNHTCPYVGLQVVSDYHTAVFPVPLPTGDYGVLLDFIFDAKKQFHVNIYFTFVEDF